MSDDEDTGFDAANDAEELQELEDVGIDPTLDFVKSVIGVLPEVLGHPSSIKARGPSAGSTLFAGDTCQ